MIRFTFESYRVKFQVIQFGLKVYFYPKAFLLQVTFGRRITELGLYLKAKKK